MSGHVDLVFLWHLHQPDYRDPVGVGDMALPWVRLHATRAYTDLAAVLEAHEGIRATVNLSSSLLSQLDDLSRGLCGDRFLDLSCRPAQELGLHDRMEILQYFFMADWEISIRPLPRYWELLHKRGRDLRAVNLERVADAFSVDEMRDLQVFFNLVWMGFTAREAEPVVRNLLAKGGGFTEVEKDVLLDAQMRLVQGVIPRWKALAESGRVELTCSPLNHPILPLLIDPGSLREASPRAPLPAGEGRPGDALEQLRRARELHLRLFGAEPRGLWPSEAALSDEVCALASEAGFTWLGSDEQVFLSATLPEDAEPSRTDIHSVWAHTGGETDAAPRLLFRDRHLSDRVGFTYAHNPPDESVPDFIEHARHVASVHGKLEPAVLLVALDGENPWEHYPDSGQAFLESLHGALEAAQVEGWLSTRTGEEVCRDHNPRILHHLGAGSWIEGKLEIWAGHAETNAAWAALDAAARALEGRRETMAPENFEEAYQHLLIAEGSDWFWWYGDDFLTETPEIFDELFRAHLSAIYKLTGEQTPRELRHPLSAAAEGASSRQVVRQPTGPITPIIDGIAAPHVDWYGAGAYRAPPLAGSMYRATQWVDVMYFGADTTELYLRLDVRDLEAADRSGVRLEVQVLSGDRDARVAFVLERGTRCPGQPIQGCARGGAMGRLFFDGIVEASLPLEGLGLGPGQKVLFAVHVLAGGVELERLPRYGHLTLDLPRRGPRSSEIA
ncbi:MAG: glycoside hydrolase family 57 protein [Deltaproteobacteria bacterium]|nr:glycoside hydrolase family 57 protein [Deltaproteobacteria bacterium]